MIDQVLDDLVHQFSDPFTFYRELIQNAMDAGTGRVDVEIERRPEEGLVVIDVADQGEGMNRPIIEQELTRLFSSSKEQDLTKIGKFGIGFVSVFALQPERVVVDTGRDGESWRVVFDGSTGYDVLRLESPVEGTRVRLYKRLAPSEVEEFVQRSKRTISFWCRYSDTQVWFMGEPVNQALEVPGLCCARREEPGTEVVAALSPESAPLAGFYNRGLTLREGQELHLPGVAFRMRSRYLEHTLTRDNVIRDHGFEQAMAVLERAVKSEIPERLFELLRTSQDPDPLLAEALPYLSEWRRLLPRQYRAMPLFPGLHGQAYSLNALRKAGLLEGVVYADPEPSDSSRALADQGIPVVRARPDEGTARALAAMTGRPVRSPSRDVLAPEVLPESEQPEELQVLEERLLKLARKGRWLPTFSRVRAARFEGILRSLPCLAQPHPGEPIRLFARGILRDLKLGRPELLLNHRHPLVQGALARARSHPDLAAYVLAKAALLDDGVPPDLEARLLERCLK